MTTRRNLIKIIILGALILLTPVCYMLGRRRRFAGHYQWQDTPGENIPLPEEVSGQRGSEVCASPDGQIVAVAGNRVMPQDVFEGKRESALTLLGYKHFIYVSKTFGKDFECVYSSPRAGVIARMALSPVMPSQIAFISIEFQTKLPVPETADEIRRMAQDSRLRETMAQDYAAALHMRDFDVVLYVLDIEKETPPKRLCTLDNVSLKSSHHTKDDLTQYDERQLELLNEMKSFRESGKYLPWDVRLKMEKEMKSVIWLPDGNALLVTDGLSLTKVDISGNKTHFYAPESTHTIGISGIFSNPYCFTNGDILLAEFGRNRENTSTDFYLTRLDGDGNVLSKTLGAFSYVSVPFDELPTPLVGEHKIAVMGNKRENMHGAFLRVSSLSSNLDDWRDSVDWNDHSKTYDIYDPNDVQFYYIPKVFLNNGEEILLFKRRAYLLASPKNSTNWEVTPWTVDNAAASWVELRKMKIS